MGSFTPVVVLGLVAGIQYGLLAVGLVLVYKASRFVNFAHGQLGIIAAAIVARLVVEGDVPYVLALPIGLLGAAAVGALVERTVVARLFHSSRLVLMIATIGVAQLLFVATLRGPLAPDRTKMTAEGYPVPFTLRWEVGGVVLGAPQVLTLIAGPLLAIALYLFFARTVTGRAIRAASSNPDAARLAGVSVRRVSTIVWILAGVLSGLTAILLAPTQPTIDVSNLGPSLLLRGLAAALIAGMLSLPTALIAGLGIGLAEQTVFWNFPQGGSADLTVFVIVLIALVVRGRALAATLRSDDDLIYVTPRRPIVGGPRAVRIDRLVGHLGWVALGAIALALPLLPGLGRQDKAMLLVLILAYALVGLSLTVLTGWSGQASLGHFAFLGVGAYAAARAAGHHWAFPAVVLVAALVAAATAVVVGLPALRHRGLFLAVTTLAFTLVAQSWLYRQPWVSEGATGNAVMLDLRLPGLGAIETPRALYYLAIAVLALAVLALYSLRRSGPGRALLAVRDHEATAAAHGISPVRTKIAALALSGALAGAAGALWAAAQRTWSFQAFESTMSLTMLGLVIVGGLGTLHGPILGAFAVFAWPFLVPGQNTFVARSISSGALLLAILLFLPGGIAGALDGGRQRLVGRLDARLRRRTGSASPTSSAAPPVEVASPRPPARLSSVGSTTTEIPLEVRNLSLSFDRKLVLNDVSLQVGSAEMVGLIGGNGAGKTTLMQCVSGHLRPDLGSIRIFGQDVVDLPAHERPTLGVFRSFQQAHLFPSLTVLESAMLALDFADPTDIVSAMAAAPWVGWAEERRRRDALDVLGGFGLDTHADKPVGQLSTGMRRLLQLAMVTAPRPRLVLLDEPTAGVAQREVEALMPRLASLTSEFGCSVLLIEHDVPLVMALCHRVYALESGSVLAEGPPEQIRSDARVIASYLGADQADIERSVAADRDSKPMHGALR